MRRVVPALALLALASLAPGGCGSSKITTAGPPPTLPPDIPPIVTIRASGLDPEVLHIFTGHKVTFINADSKAHAIYADPHPAHSTCTGLLNVGELQPAEQREVPNLPSDACFFHDEGNLGVKAFQGTLVIH